MALNWNEIKDRAVRFSKEWEDTTSEDAEAKSFLDAFFEVFGIPRKKIGTFEHRIKKLDEGDGYIDMLWEGHILVEMKSEEKVLTYRSQFFSSEANRMEFLFGLYEKYTADLFTVDGKKGKRK